MVAEWAVDFDQASSNYGRTLKKLATGSGVTSNQGNKEWSRAWMYFNSVEDGARVTRGWFKVVPAEGLASTMMTRMVGTTRITVVICMQVS